MRVLVVEDDRLLGEGLVTGLEADGYAVSWVREGTHVQPELEAARYEAVVLDVNLPDGSGFDVVRALRAAGIDVPVLIVTARQSVEDRVHGLDLGADDFLVKPFSLAELCARLRALRRRSEGRSRPMLLHGAVRLDPARHAVFLHGEEVELGRREYSMLELLLTRRGQVVTRRDIEDQLYGWEELVESNTIEVYVHHLRRRFGNDLIRTVRGVGYTIDRPAESDAG